jgi:hypothetical protein
VIFYSFCLDSLIES